MAFDLSPDMRVYVAGHGGLVGSAIWRHLQALGFEDLIGWRSAEVDLRIASRLLTLCSTPARTW